MSIQRDCDALARRVRTLESRCQELDNALHLLTHNIRDFLERLEALEKAGQGLHPLSQSDEMKELEALYDACHYKINDLVKSGKQSKAWGVAEMRSLSSAYMGEDLCRMRDHARFLDMVSKQKGRRAQCSREES